MKIEPALDSDVTSLSELNNHFAPQGLTLPRSESWVVEPHRRLPGRARRARARAGVRLPRRLLTRRWSNSSRSPYNLSLQGKGMGSALIAAAVDLARRRGYPELFAVSFSDSLFQHCGFRFGDINRYPEKRARYAKVSDDEWTVGQKHCFVMDLANRPAAGAG